MIVYIVFSLLADFMLPFSQPINFIIMISSFLFVVLILFPVNIALKAYKLLFKTKSKYYDEKIWKRMLKKDSGEYFKIYFE